jgi:hypothetical protein
MGARAHKSPESAFIRFVSAATHPATELSDPTYRKNRAAKLTALLIFMFFPRAGLGVSSSISPGSKFIPAKSTAVTKEHAAIA